MFHHIGQLLLIWATPLCLGILLHGNQRPFFQFHQTASTSSKWGIKSAFHWLNFFFIIKKVNINKNPPPPFLETTTTTTKDKEKKTKWNWTWVHLYTSQAPFHLASPAKTTETAVGAPFVDREERQLQEQNTMKQREAAAVHLTSCCKLRWVYKHSRVV